MDRRTFTQILAVAGGALTGLPAAVDADERNRPADDQVGTQPTALPTTPDHLVPPEPVNVHDIKDLAEATLPKATFDYITTGSADELTLRDNIAAFEKIRVYPPLLTGVSQVDLSTTVLKQQISLPMLLAPVACQRMYHPEGALAAARAAGAAGTIYGVSSSVGHSVEEVASAGDGPKWFQLYVPKDKAVAKQLVQRVERAGYGAIILTVDLGEWKDADRRNRFTLPREMLLKHLRDAGFTGLRDDISYEDLLAFNAQAWDLGLSWELFDWLRSFTKLPLLIKGVLRPADAQKAVSIGLDGIVVSNHGGRRLDGMPATIDVLPGIVAAVNGRAEVLMDGGVRRGTDILKALAVGAKAVLIGRPYAWALAADGERGVAKVIELLRDELTNAMLACGCENVSEVNKSLIMPNG